MLNSSDYAKNYASTIGKSLLVKRRLFSQANLALLCHAGWISCNNHGSTFMSCPESFNSKNWPITVYCLLYGALQICHIAHGLSV